MTVNLVLVKEIVDSVYATSAKGYKQQVEEILGELLYSGKISKNEMQEIEEYLDENMYSSLAAKIRVHEQLDNEHFSELPQKVQNIIIKTGLSNSEIREIVSPYMDDYTINSANLTKSEMKDVKAGKLSRSEEENIINDINARIKSNGYGKTLDKHEVKVLLKGYGFNYGTARDSSILKDGILFITAPIFFILYKQNNNKEELAYPTLDNKDYIQNGSVTNKTEAKMQDLARTPILEQIPDDYGIEEEMSDSEMRY